MTKIIILMNHKLSDNTPSQRILIVFLQNTSHTKSKAYKHK